jgi:hypothetical protein
VGGVSEPTCEATLSRPILVCLFIEPFWEVCMVPSPSLETTVISHFYINPNMCSNDIQPFQIDSRFITVNISLGLPASSKNFSGSPTPIQHKTATPFEIVVVVKCM